jgi:hypothetical protein
MILYFRVSKETVGSGDEQKRGCRLGLWNIYLYPIMS